MQIKTVRAINGWRWILGGAALFRKNPAQWVIMTGILFLASRLLFIVPAIAVIAVLISPHFMVGLSHGAQALEQGKPLRLAYLISGFLKSFAPLALIGALSLLGQFVMLKVMLAFGGGDALQNLSSIMADQTTTNKSIPLASISATLLRAKLIGFAASVPLMMAAWFSPLLVFFDDVALRRALWLSMIACFKNILALAVYCLAVLVPVVILSPLSLITRQPDLSIWLIAPILIPSFYVSYRDLFIAEQA